MENKVIINGTVYVPETEAGANAKNTDGLEYCIIRTYSAGVHAGYVESREGKEVVLRNSRRLWEWAGAFTLSELSKNGTTKPNDCKFATVIDKITLTETIEIINCTETARQSIEGVDDYECDFSDGYGWGCGCGDVLMPWRCVDAMVTVIVESHFEGIVYQYGNYDDDMWYIHGKTEGYA